jgi:hypothetical protein
MHLARLAACPYLEGMERIETGAWGWAIIWLTLAYIVGLILLKEAGGMEWLLALSAAKR